jgi:hypothetical protein
MSFDPSFFEEVREPQRVSLEPAPDMIGSDRQNGTNQMKIMIKYYAIAIAITLALAWIANKADGPNHVNLCAPHCGGYDGGLERAARDGRGF